MSIENNLKRIADALEKIAEGFTADKQPAPAAPATTEAPAAPAAPATTEAPTAPAAPATTEAPAAPVKTPEELNAILVAEFKRLGSREPIDAVMKELGVTSVADLAADKQQELISKVQAIQPGA